MREKLYFPAAPHALLLLAAAALLAAAPGFLQAQSSGPMRTPEPEKLPQPMPSGAAQPPPVAPDEIIRRFAAREDDMVRAIKGYSFQKEIRVQELGPDRKAAGQYDVVLQSHISSEGKISEKMVNRQASTLHYLDLERGDNDLVAAAPMFPLTTAMLPKYEITYGGTEQVDELNTYYFTVKPKAVERSRAYFSGVVWVDTQELAIVKMIGKWVTELGDVKAADLPFTLFETYRQEVGKNLWFPAYARSDETLEQGGAHIPIRIIVKWDKYAQQANTPASDAAAPPMAPASPDKP
jgi:hypothetical protein